jgi:hypothetical protein
MTLVVQINSFIVIQVSCTYSFANLVNFRSNSATTCVGKTYSFLFAFQIIDLYQQKLTSKPMKYANLQRKMFIILYGVSTFGIACCLGCARRTTQHLTTQRAGFCALQGQVSRRSERAVHVGQFQKSSC